MHPKLKMLKEVLRQMQCAMADGEGDDESAGKEAMETLAEVGDEKKVAASEEEGEDVGEESELDAEKKDYMRHGKKLPMGGKGAKAIMMNLSSGKAPGGKKLKYG